MFEGSTWVALAASLVFLVRVVHTEILTPPYFNLAEGRNITASATCGEDIEGPELYCKLVGTNADNKNNTENELYESVIHGQVGTKNNNFSFSPTYTSIGYLIEK